MVEPSVLIGLSGATGLGTDFCPAHLITGRVPNRRAESTLW